MSDDHWVASWAAPAQGPFPIGNSLMQPDQRFAFPNPERGANDQTFRLVLRPTIWGKQARLRFSNVFGTNTVTFADAFVGLHAGGARVLAGSNRSVSFSGKKSVSVAPGDYVWSDPVGIDFWTVSDAASFIGRKLAVSFCVPGESGPMTWHAKALTTSYVSAPGRGSIGSAEDEGGFPYTTASWFFLDALEMMMPAESYAIVALGDSITEGTGSTFNGDDRWPDILARRLHARYGNRIAVVNAGIGGNQIVKPSLYDARHPFTGGPPAVSRFGRDVLELSGVRVVIWMEGINDFSRNGNSSLELVQKTMSETIAHLRARKRDLMVIGGTLTSSLGSINEVHGFVEEDANRKGLNAFIRSSPLFDYVVDFDAATTDSETGKLRDEFVPSSTTGSGGDGLHPNRAGYLAMASAFDLDIFDVVRIQHLAFLREPPR